MVLGREHEAPCGREIENFGIVRNLENDGGEMRTGKTFEPRSQRLDRIGGAQKKKMARIETEVQKARRMNLALLESGNRGGGRFCCTYAATFAAA